MFSYIETDATGRNVYTTIPVDGEQTCGGIGTCEFKIQWNDANSVWEFIADQGNGDFAESYVIYTNASTSSPNPPSLILGTWKENGSVTQSECGGDLSVSNAILTGDVQDEELSALSIFNSNVVTVYPLPANHLVQIKTELTIKKLVVFDLQGKRVKQKAGNLKQLDVSHLKPGLYFLKIETRGGLLFKQIMVN